MNIIFMGTPDFAVPCLERIIEDGHKVSAVFTRADKPVGRKKVMTPPPVKVKALEHNIPVFQPEKIKQNPEVFEILNKINPDVIVVVAYGRILPKEILDFPKYGCVNIHGSLLPRHRGASPIQWSIVCGDRVTGVSAQLMDEGVDTGDIIMTEEMEITPYDTYETLYDRMSLVGAKVLSKALFELENGTAKRVKQPNVGANYAPIITKQMGQLDFSKKAAELDCLIRGFTPWPLAYFYFNDRRFKIYKAKPSHKTNKTAGTFFTEKGRAYVACGDGFALELLEICPDGSKRMDSGAFVNGRFVEDGAIIKFIEE